MCLDKARELRYKYLHVSHAVVGLLLGLFFHTEYHDGVSNTVNIFMFPDLFISTGLEVALVARRWDTALDIN